MNRKQRRAAGKAAGPGRPPAPPGGHDLSALLAIAVQHHQAGQLADAERVYRQILAADPDHADSLHNLGLIAHQVGQHEAAIALIDRALARNDRVPHFHAGLAIACHAAGRSDRAIDHCRRAIALKPDHLGAQLLLADELRATGRRDEAIAAYERARTLDPQRATIDANLGNLYAGRGDRDAAMACYRRGLARDPDHVDMLNNLGAAHVARGELADAIPLYARALALRPEFLVARQNLAATLIAAGDPLAALGTVVHGPAAAAAPDSRLLFLQCLQALASVPRVDGIRDWLVAALDTPWGRPSDLARPSAGVIRHDPAAAACLARVAAAPIAAPELVALPGYAVLAADPLLHALLRNARNCDIEIERLLAAARAALLAACLDGTAPSDDASRAVAVSLAHQGFINEYVVAEPDTERAEAARLQAMMAAALRAGEPVPALWPLLLGACAPLHALPERDLLMARAWPDDVAGVLTRQIAEPDAEARLRETIPRLTAIEDEVSRLVQGQYEESPYPRWTKAAPTGRPMPIAERLARLFPHADLSGHVGGATPDVLVAGCGTGQQLVDVAGRIAGAAILAVDLSRASLAYAQRQTIAMGLADITFAQADILQLGALDRRFDVVDCGGVLHHLGDPLAGWRVLLSLLRPGGVMRIALYSELARTSVVAARAFVAAHGHAATPDGIRRFRRDVSALPADDPARAIAASPDFFSISDCRDLVFHVQEHRFTLPQIRDFIAADDLTFLGFELPPDLLRRYDAACPHDRARTDLDGWHRFEQANPEAFGGMYQFWVRRRPAREAATPGASPGSSPGAGPGASPVA